jgi:CheY-like chemotaxis protein
MSKPLKGKTVLIVDDQKFIRGMIVEAARRLGSILVLEAGDGFEAVQMLGAGEAEMAGNSLLASRPDITGDMNRRRHDVDCVVTDIRMSPMNGLELLKAIRCGLAGSRRDLPVVIMSAHSDESLIGAAIALDANAFSAKPVSQATIAEKIVRAITMVNEIKDREQYMSLIVPEVDESYLLLDATKMGSNMLTIRAMDVAMAKGTTAIRVPIGQIEIDDVLAENIMSVSGALIVPSGTKISLPLLNAIHDLRALAIFTTTIAVRRRSM